MKEQRIVKKFDKGYPMRTSRDESAKPETMMIPLYGTPAAIGEIWGRINRDCIGRDMNEFFLAPAREAGIARETLIERTKSFIRIAERIAPHWLDEARAIARAADVLEDLYIAFIANVYRGMFLHHECTSYAVSPEYTDGKAILFHKNRDNADRAQSAFILESNIPGVNKFIGVTDAGVLGCSMLVNDKGLACSADTGGMAVKTPRFRGIMNHFMKRHVAERASSCEEALAMIEEFVRKGEYAGGNKTGTHWLFVDKTGKILEISHNSDELTHAWHAEKVYFSVRGDTKAAHRLRDAANPIDFALFHSVSRDPSICLDSSISGMTVEIDRDRPDLFTCAWITLPAHAGAFPLLMGGRATPRSLLDGEAYRLARERRVPDATWARIEHGMHLGKTELCDGLRAIRAPAGETKAWRNAVDAWTQAQSNMMMNILRLSQQDSGNTASNVKPTEKPGIADKAKENHE